MCSDTSIECRKNKSHEIILKNIGNVSYNAERRLQVTERAGSSSNKSSIVPMKTKIGEKELKDKKGLDSKVHEQDEQQQEVQKVNKSFHEGSSVSKSWIDSRKKKLNTNDVLTVKPKIQLSKKAALHQQTWKHVREMNRRLKFRENEDLDIDDPDEEQEGCEAIRRLKLGALNPYTSSSNNIFPKVQKLLIGTQKPVSKDENVKRSKKRDDVFAGVARTIPKDNEKSSQESFSFHKCEHYNENYSYKDYYDCNICPKQVNSLLKSFTFINDKLNILPNMPASIASREQENVFICGVVGFDRAKRMSIIRQLCIAPHISSIPSKKTSPSSLIDFHITPDNFSILELMMSNENLNSDTGCNTTYTYNNRHHPSLCNNDRKLAISSSLISFLLLSCSIVIVICESDEDIKSRLHHQKQASNQQLFYLLSSATERVKQLNHTRKDKPLAEVIWVQFDSEKYGITKKRYEKKVSFLTDKLAKNNINCNPSPEYIFNNIALDKTHDNINFSRISNKHGTKTHPSPISVNSAKNFMTGKSILGDLIDDISDFDKSDDIISVVDFSDSFSLSSINSGLDKTDGNRR